MPTRTALRLAEEALAYFSSLPGGSPDWVNEETNTVPIRAWNCSFVLAHRDEPHCDDDGCKIERPASLGAALAWVGALTALSAVNDEHSFDLLAANFGPLARRGSVVVYINSSYGADGPECHPGPCDGYAASCDPGSRTDWWGLYCEAHEWGSPYFKSRAAALKALDKPSARWCPKCAAVAVYWALPAKERQAYERDRDSFEAVKARHLHDLLAGTEEP